MAQPIISNILHLTLSYILFGLYANIRIYHKRQRDTKEKSLLLCALCGEIKTVNFPFFGQYKIRQF